MFGRRNTANVGEKRGTNAEVICLIPSAESDIRVPWTVGDACQGVQIFGGTGSGKTTGSGRHLALGMLAPASQKAAATFGGLVLTAKPDERETWEAYARETGRTADLMVVRPGGPFRCNFLNYEFEAQEQTGALTQSLVNLFSLAVGAGEERRSSSEPYWDDTFRQLLTNAIDLVAMAKRKVSLRDIIEVILTAPQSHSDSHSKSWQDSFCWKCMEEAQERERDPARREDLRQTIDYWLLDFAGLANRTRSVVVTSFTSKATALLRSPLRELFCSEEPDTVKPEHSHAGKIIILDLPVKEFGEAGRFAQILFKTVWQRSTERRVQKLNPASNEFDPNQRPVFLWADESQYFVTAHDMLFQQTARSARAATVYLTQNISNYYAALGSGHGNSATDSLLGNLQTKIFHANGDPATNEWAERTFAKGIVDLNGFQWAVDRGASWSGGESLQPLVPAILFTTLKKGDADPEIEALIFQAGRKLDEVNNYLLAKFIRPATR